MPDQPAVSVVITNHNYARYLPDAIESALGQEYGPVEVVVVDDGSTDESREVLAGYERRLVCVLKDQGGQTSAMNAGFTASRGEIVVFLDADDTLLPLTVRQVADAFGDGSVVKVHWPLLEVDGDGRRTGRQWPEQPLLEGDTRDLSALHGASAGDSPPTSGNAWSRDFLESVLPLPEIERELHVGSASADDCLSFLAALSGPVARLAAPGGTYRIHGDNDYAATPFEERLERSLAISDRRHALAFEHARRLGAPADRDAWRRSSWFHQVAESLEEIKDLIQPGRGFILVDEAQWGVGDRICDRPVFAFLERDGQYFGRPNDDATAISELERLREVGASFLVFTWPTFWWMDTYGGFAGYVLQRYRKVHDNERLLIFDLHGSGKG